MLNIVYSGMSLRMLFIPLTKLGFYVFQRVLMYCTFKAIR